MVPGVPARDQDGAKADSYITPENDAPLRRSDRRGQTCHWISELHLVDRELGSGGFYEQLLDLG